MCLGGMCVLVFEPRIHVSYSSVVASSRCIVASSWRSGELILKHFVAVVRFIKKTTIKVKEKHIEPMIRKK